MILDGCTRRLFAASLFWVILVSGTLIAAKPDYPPGGLSSLEVDAFVRLIEEWHLLRTDVTSEDQATLFERFAAKLDPQRVYFKESDLVAFAARHPAGARRAAWQNGDFSAVHEMHKIFRETVRERSRWIAEQLEQIELGENTDVTPPAALADWQSRSVTLDNWWAQHLRHECAQECVSGLSIAEAGAAVGNVYATRMRLIESATPADVEARFLNCFAELFDDRTAYFSPTEYDDLRQSMNSEEVGIGALLRLDGNVCTVEQLHPGGPLAKSGKAHAGDTLRASRTLSRERTDLGGLDLNQITDLLRGPAGTELEVLVGHPNSGFREWVQLRRASVPFQTVRTLLASVRSSPEKLHRFGVVSIPALYGEIPEQRFASVHAHVAAALARLDETGAEGLVLDLRRNGGGLLSEALEVAGLFVGPKRLLRLKNYDHKLKVENGRQPASLYQKALVVLVDEDTASGAEIIAGVLKDYSRAIVVGTERTAASGSVQTIVELNELNRKRMRSKTPSGAAKLTVQAFYLPCGQSTEQSGVTPHVVLPRTIFRADPRSNVPAKASSFGRLPNEAPPPPSGWSEQLTRLIQQSAGRVEHHPEWHYYRKWSLPEMGTTGTITLSDLRTRMRNRAGHAAEFEAEGAKLRDSSIPLVELLDSQASFAAVPAAVYGGTGPLDVPLNEALRVLADLVSPAQP